MLIDACIRSFVRNLGSSPPQAPFSGSNVHFCQIDAVYLLSRTRPRTSVKHAFDWGCAFGRRWGLSARPECPLDPQNEPCFEETTLWSSCRFGSLLPVIWSFVSDCRKLISVLPKRLKAVCDGATQHFPSFRELHFRVVTLTGRSRSAPDKKMLAPTGQPENGASMFHACHI